jgi:hypothetical protein
MLGFLAQDVRLKKMVKTKNRYIPLNVGQVGHFWSPKIHGNLSDHGGTLDGDVVAVHSCWNIIICMRMARPHGLVR